MAGGLTSLVHAEQASRVEEDPDPSVTPQALQSAPSDRLPSGRNRPEPTGRFELPASGLRNSRTRH
jgi:hypothetical protein